MLRIGLTGGIGCGKTTVSDLFTQYGIPVLDADTIAKELVEPGQPALQLIVKLFGPEVLQQGGQLDRKKLRDIVFADSTKREQLEQILHPRIDAAMEQRVKQLQQPYAIFSIPLLFEKDKKAQVDRILVVDCPVELQYRRTRQRDALSREQVAATISAQVSREQRLAAADDIISNDGNLEQLSTEVEKLHHKYLSLATG